ncbi:HAD family phosphatase [Spirillospora sp. NPDC029432]|uniref:HAD family hydrolase n=1 Tax=Spirillospora sp. NPDC029432 TaxID=3154599 RepID=UPI003453E648
MTSLHALFEQAEALLLDFDGPVCKLFAGYPAQEAADEIRSLLGDHQDQLPEHLKHGPDPLKLVRWIGANTPQLLPTAEQALARAESRAAESATPTPHADAMIRATAESGRPVVMVSNNSAEAIWRYLRAHGLDQHIRAVVGRDPQHPDQMKPDVRPILRAAQEAGVPSDRCLLIGDTPTDIEAAEKAGTPTIGYAKRESRVHELGAVGADVVVESIALLAEAAGALQLDSQ